MGEKIFISYCRKDLAKAKQIKKEIEKSTSTRCWMDLEGIESGSQFEDVIISAIDNAKVVLFLLSENSMESEYSQKEIRYAYKKRKKFVPVNIDGCSPNGWFLFTFSGTDVIDYSEQDQRNKLMKDLVEWINIDKPIVGTDTDNNEGPPPTPPNEGFLSKIFNTTLIVQAFLFGGILISLLTMYRIGVVYNYPFGMTSRFNMLLCVCLCGTLYFTYQLYKKKRIAFYILCLLDVIEILLLCALCYRITDVASNYKYFPYVDLNELGRWIHSWGFLMGAFLMEFFAFFHITIMTFVLFIKYKGKRIWDRLH